MELIAGFIGGVVACGAARLAARWRIRRRHRTELDRLHERRREELRRSVDGLARRAAPKGAGVPTR